MCGNEKIADCGLRSEEEIRNADFGLRNNSPHSELPSHSALRTPHSAIPTGITLIEVLISMFVLLFGLMGVAAIFPVASHYVLEGDKRDRSSGLAQIAFEELKARKILRPTRWVIPGQNYAYPFIFQGKFQNVSDPGHVLIIDPLGSAQSIATLDRTFFPFGVPTQMVNVVPEWPAKMNSLNHPLVGTQWPLRRVTLDPDQDSFNGNIITGPSAETTFRLRDDLAVEQPDAGDRPSVQRWGVNNNGTPNDLTDDQLLSRQYTGDYSWLATVVPTSIRALVGLQPGSNIKDAFYEVTTVVFYKRDIVPSTSTAGSPGSERLIAAEFLNSSELAIYDSDANDRNVVDLALDGIKPTNWIAVMGVNQITGVFMMKWYKIQAMDDEVSVNQPLPGAGNKDVRYVMVQGADWPPSSYANLRVAILPGAIDAYTRVMQVDVE